MKNYQLLKKIIFIPLILVICICVGYYYIYQDIETKNQNILDLQGKIKIQNDNEQYIKSIGSAVQNSQDNVDKISNAILDKDGDVLFIENLEKIAKDNGLEINIDYLMLDNLSGLSKMNMTTLDIRATIHGSWSGNYLFVKELEAMPFILRIEKLSLTNITDSTYDQSAKKIVTSNVGWQSVFEIHVLKYK